MRQQVKLSAIRFRGSVDRSTKCQGVCACVKMGVGVRVCVGGGGGG